jgi:hypothetical protein
MAQSGLSFGRREATTGGGFAFLCSGWPTRAPCPVAVFNGLTTAPRTVSWPTPISRIPIGM